MTLFLIVPMTGLSKEIKKTEGYIPLTNQEAENWLMTITYQQLLDFIIAYDLVEHSIPQITPAKKLIFIEGRDLHITEQEPMRINIGHLEYEISTGDEIYPDFIPKRNTKPYIYVGIGGLITGIIITALIGM